VTTLRLPPSLTHLNADACAREYLMVMRADTGPVTLIDASELVHFDSSVLALLLTLVRNMKERNGVLQISGLPDRARNLANVYGVGEMLPI
jgi:phospholipid transport system transporter-binding protein